MENIGSSFKIAPVSSSTTIDGGSVPTRSFSQEKLWTVLTGFILLAVVYYYRAFLFRIYNGGIMNYIWSALYLTSNGEVATTHIPENSLANSLL
jgi:hypothetical protein